MSEINGGVLKKKSEGRNTWIALEDKENRSKISMNKIIGWYCSKYDGSILVTIKMYLDM